MTTSRGTNLAGIRPIDAAILEAGIIANPWMGPDETALRYYIACIIQRLLTRPGRNLTNLLAAHPHGVSRDTAIQDAEYLRSLDYATDFGHDATDASALHYLLQRGQPATLPAAAWERLRAHLRNGHVPDEAESATELLAAWVLYHILGPAFGKDTATVPIRAEYPTSAITAVAAHYGDLGWAIAVTTEGFTLSYGPIPRATDP
jgi:hypothetical protein